MYIQQHKDLLYFKRDAETPLPYVSAARDLQCRLIGRMTFLNLMQIHITMGKSGDQLIFNC